MALQPEFLFNNGTEDNVEEFPKGSLKGGGLCWNAIYNASVQHRMYHFGKVIEITPDDIASLNPSSHTTPQNGLKIILGKFSNDVEFGVSIWCIHFEGGVPHGTYTVDSVEMCGIYKKGNTYYYANDSSATPVGAGLQYKGSTANSGQGTNLVSYACPINIVKTYGIKLCFNTDYAIGQGQAEVGVTKATSFSIMAFVPCQASNNVAGLQSFAHIQSNGIYFDIWTDSQEPLIDNPQYFYYGYDYNQFTGIGYIFKTENLNNIKTFLNGVSPITEDPWKKGSVDDPTQDYDPSTPGGGGGNYDKKSDPIDFPALPTGGALASGACKAYEVTSANMKTIFSKLWSSSVFDINDFQKLVDNPMDCIISFHAVPVQPLTSASNVIYIGNFNTEVSGMSIGSQYLTIDCGSLNVKEFWGSALDYNPYTKTEIYLPFIGVKELNTDDVMNNKIHIKYNVDVINGDCVANIKCGNSVLYKYAGNLKQQIPVTGRASDMSMNLIQGALSAFAGGLMGGAVGGPVGAAIAAGAGLSAASGVVGSKITTNRASGLTGNYGILDDFVPYLILHRPIQSLADKFKSFKGYPCNITALLSSVSGYTEVEYINLGNISNATSEEMNEIKNLLESGALL